MKLSVADTGRGIHQEHLSHIFDPFFSTKGDVGGGLGLTTVYSQVEEHHGRMRVQSEVGKGTTFELFFPGAEAITENIDSSRNQVMSAIELSVPSTPVLQPTAEILPCEKPSAPEDAKHILVVEDEPMLRNLYQTILEKQGISSDLAEDGEQALLMWKTNPAKYAVVVTDYSMPNMNGRHLVKKLRETAPELPVIMTTGHGDVFTPQDLENWGIHHCLDKPVNFRELVAIIKQFLI
ncbi:MAG: response regulator [SAR324 cluster bacterium]|nr:response regulator [SAR324 cluster bacterium]